MLKVSQRHTSQVNHNAHKPSTYGKNGHHHHLWNSKSSNNIPVVSYLHSFFLPATEWPPSSIPSMPSANPVGARLLGNLLKFHQTSARTLVGAMSSMPRGKRHKRGSLFLLVVHSSCFTNTETHTEDTPKKKHSLCSPSNWTCIFCPVPSEMHGHEGCGWLSTSPAAF